MNMIITITKRITRVILYNNNCSMPQPAFENKMIHFYVTLRKFFERVVALYEARNRINNKWENKFSFSIRLFSRLIDFFHEENKVEEKHCITR